MAGYEYFGSRVYYLKENGNVVFKTGQAEGWVTEIKPEKDWEIYEELKKYTKESLDYIQLKYDEYSTEFAECTSYKVNIETKKLEFDYTPKPEPPGVPQTPTIHERMETQEKANKAQDDLILDNAYRVALLELNAQGIAL